MDCSTISAVFRARLNHTWEAPIKPNSLHQRSKEQVVPKSFVNTSAKSAGSVRDNREPLEREHDPVNFAEQAAAGEERFRRYFDLGLIGMAITSPTKGCLEVNDELCRLLG